MIFYFIFITVISSCNSDDNEINQGDELLGSWELSSSNDSSSYGIDFMPDNVCGWRYTSMFPDGNVISSYEVSNWSVIDNPKTLIIPELELKSSYSINADGQLIIDNLKKGLPFNKLN